LQDADPNTQIAAARALGTIGARSASSSVPALIAVLKTPYARFVTPGTATNPELLRRMQLEENGDLEGLVHAAVADASRGSGNPLIRKNGRI